MLSHYAYFDALAVCANLPKDLIRIAKLEIHLFAYLSCLLSLYDRQPASAWGYRFGVTRDGYPFSSDNEDAIGHLISRGKLVCDGEYVSLSEPGEIEYSFLSALSVYRSRVSFIEGACSSALAMPLGSIRQAIYRDPDIQRSFSLSQPRMLLSEEAQHQLYAQFATLSQVIGVDVKDLMVPAVIWLMYHTSPLD